MKRLVLVNSHPPFSAVHKYMMEISRCVESPITIINLLYSNRTRKWDLSSEGERFKGLAGNIFVLNLALGRFSFPNALNLVKRLSGEDTIVHYIHQLTRPLAKPDNRTVATILDPIESNLPARRYQNLTDKTIHRAYFRVFSHVKNANYRRYSVFQSIITISDVVKDSLIKFGFKGEITTIYPPVGEHFKWLDSPEGLRDELGLPRNKNLVLSVSTSDQRKNLSTVSKVMKVLGEDYSLVRIGQPLGNSFSFSNVPNDIVNKIYNACDVLLIPSLQEGFGYPIPEAMSVGLPVVASNIPVFREAFGDSIVMKDPFDVNGLKYAVIDACENKEEHAKSGLNKSKEFSFELYKKKVAHYYENILRE